MKKITLTIAALVAAFAMNAQTTNVSFETSEGYAEGLLDTQNSWSVTEVVADQFYVSSNLASDGLLSVYGQSSNEQYDNGQGQAALIGAFSPMYSISSSSFSISMDVYIETPTTANNGSDIHLGAQSTGEQFITSRVVFDYQSNIKVVDDASGQPAYENIGTYAFDTWYNIEINYDFNNGSIEYYIDNTLAYSGNVWTSATTVDQLTFLFDNYESSFYVDNVVINEAGNMSVNKFNNIDLTHFNNDQILTIDSNSNLEILSIYSILGKKISTETLNGNNANINISHLQSGVYLAKVSAEGKTKTFKFIKK